MNEDWNEEKPGAAQPEAEQPQAEVAEEAEQPLEDQQAQADADAERRAKLKQTAKKEIREWIVALVSALVVVLLVRAFLFTVIRVDGSSMYPTLINDERLFVTVADVKLGYVERGDVVICHYPNRGRTYFVKRVVGVPGDTVYRENGVTHIVYETVDENGEAITVDNPLDAEFVSIFYNPANDYEPYVLADDEYFVVGDNRGNSHDSRDWSDSDPSRDVGPITKDMLVGRVRCVIWPFNRIRSVE